MTFKEAARRFVVHARTTWMVAVALLAAAFVTSVTVDLGPMLRARAEAAGSKQIDRPLHMGGLSIRLFDGRFVVHDLLIEGLSPTASPFLKAREIVVSMPWTALFRRELLFDSIEMTDWQMLVETFRGGRHNFPRFTSNTRSSGPRLFTTTVQYVRARRGQFTFLDHSTPWSTVVRNLDVTVVKAVGYRGQATSSGGTVAIQQYVPMSADLRTWFRIADGKVLLDRIELDTDGARTLCTGEVDLRHWPEQTYQVRSVVDLPRMRQIFWARDRFSLSGTAQFRGAFHLFKGGRELKGDFTSEEAGLNRYRFPDLQGSLVWVSDRFEVTHAESGFYGGRTRFTYLMAPLGQPAPARARLEVAYEQVDLETFMREMAFNGIRLTGRATGRNLLEWPLGHFGEHAGHGQVTAEPPAGVRLAGRALPSPLPARSFAHVHGDPFPPMVTVPIGGELNYQYGPEWVDVAASRIATPTTFVEFQGRTAWGERSIMPFHVTSTDWQESDRLLAGIITAFGSTTRAVEMGGAGQFDGVMLNAFRAPRVEGVFVGQGMRAWDVEWGSGRATIAVENAYLDVTDAVIRKGDAQLQAQGRFALGYPRKDRGEEINGRIKVERWPVADLRHGFDLDDYPIDGLMTGEIHLYGPYERPFGFGRIAIEPGTAYGEVFQSASAALRFEGTGVRFDGLEMRKGPGSIRGAAYVGWNATYSFNADGRGIPLEAVNALAFPQAPLTGLVEFSASGSGSFYTPAYDVRGRIVDLFVRDEGIGQVSGRIAVRGESLNFEMEAASPRLAVSGSGRVSLEPGYVGDVSLRFTDSSLDPYLRLIRPGLSPFTTAVASGTLHVDGSLASIDALRAQAQVDQLDLRLFDYRVRNSGPIRIDLDQNIVRVRQLELEGEDTQLTIAGAVNLGTERVALHAAGAVNLGILQGFVRDIRSSGRAAVTADIEGPAGKPVITGQATITDGRLRYFGLPHSIESINGRLAFAGGSIRVDDLVAKVGQGDVRFGGRIGLSGLQPVQFDLTATGENMQLRYPAGFRSLVDADLALRGTVEAPTLSGVVTVRSATLKRRFDLGSGLIELAGAPAAPAPSASPAPTTLPLRYDIRLVAPSSLEIDNNVARITSSADLTLRGTYDRPVLLGRVEIDRGEVRFEGQRYVVTRGTVDFSNPTRIEPDFDVEAETRVRSPGQTYNVTIRAAGTMQRIQQFDLASDPPLPQVDILAMLLGDVRSTQDAELRELQSPNDVERNLIQARAARLIASPISSNVQRAVEQTFGVDTFQITPLLTDPNQSSTRFAPTARLTIGKRISDRVYLTFSRSLTSSMRDQIIMLEYDQSDRLSWILTQNEDRTYSLDVRVRHTFR